MPSPGKLHNEIAQASFAQTSPSKATKLRDQVATATDYSEEAEDQRKQLEKLSRGLKDLLRHEAVYTDVDISDDGWVPVAQALEHLREERGIEGTEAEVDKITEEVRTSLLPPLSSWSFLTFVNAPSLCDSLLLSLVSRRRRRPLRRRAAL